MSNNDKKEIIVNLIKSWIDCDLPSVFLRQNIFAFHKNKSIRKAYTIIGPRRSGKTFFCYQIIQDLIKKHKVNKKNILYFNMENDELYPMGLDDLNNIIDIYFQITGLIDQEIYIFLDEIQEVEHWEKFIRKILDNFKKITIILTGSSSKLLSKEIATSLRGRTISYEILPLNYTEYLNWHKFKKEKYLSKENRLKNSNILQNFLYHGSFPEISLEENNSIKYKYLKDYLDLIFYKDIIERNNIKNIKKAKNLRNIFISKLSEIISVNAISQNMSIEANTISNWLNCFVDAYFIFELKKFSFSTYTQEKSLTKLYLIDNGFYHLLYGVYKNDLGKLLENLVFLEFRKKGFLENEQIFYYKTKNGHEIDFLIMINKQIIPIQVAYNVDDESTLKRETRSILELFKENQNITNGYIITFNQNKDINDSNIKIISFYNFFGYEINKYQNLFTSA